MRRKRLAPFGMWIVFEIVAVTLWLTKDNLFYLLNFSYIGTSITVGLLLFQFNYKHARRIVQLLVGLYMLIYLGLYAGKTCRLKVFGIICLPEYLKQLRSIMLLQKYSDHFCLEEDGADMPVGQLWCWTFYHIKSLRLQEKR